MSTHKYIDRFCGAALALTLLAALLFMNGESLGLQPASRVMGYETRLFDTGRVHTLDIVMDDWDGFIETCENEEYASCTVVIDGESCHNVGIRAKGNTSLSMVSSMDSSRYSFKLEFDHYDSTRTYYGLDKLSLNNIIQDTTYMKDYLTYQLMNAYGAAAPLSSYVYITVNGEDWGLYLAAEGVEDGFLQRNYGKDSGELYKPDSMSFGGGRGNGRDFDMDDFQGDRGRPPSPPEESGGSLGGFPDSFSPPAESGDFEPPPEEMGGGRGFFSGGMGSDDVKLRYIDDDPASYSNIFENAKTDITEADQARLIASLKALSAGENLEEVLDIDQVLRYFVVHNFVCNGDSYTGSMVHNYYLYEKDGQLSMIPWDYNLAFGTFRSAGASTEVNAPIDTPVSGGDSRPMVDWIFDNDEYTAMYHQYFSDFLETVNISDIINAAETLIAPYVEKDPTKFYSFAEFTAGVETLREFCSLRSESISGQLDGTIPSTEDGQNSDPSALIDASHLSLSNMGGMGNQQGGGFAHRTSGEEAPHDFENPGMAFLPVLPEDGTLSDGNPLNGNDPTVSANFDSASWSSSSENHLPASGNSSCQSSDEKAQPSTDFETASASPNLEDRPSTGNENQRPGFPRQDDSLSLTHANEQNLPLILVYVAVLLAGLVFAFKFKRNS